MTQICPDFRINIWFHIFFQIFATLFTKNAKGGSDKYEIWHIRQLDPAEKKNFKIVFLSHQAVMEQISSKYFYHLFHQMFLSKTNEPKKMRHEN